MIIENVTLLVRITGANKKYYSEKLHIKLKYGDIVKVDQKMIAPRSRTLIYCECDICGDVFSRKMIDILQKNRTIESPTMCGQECKKEYMRRNNPNPPKDKIKVNCSVCNKNLEVVESVYKKQEHHLCSRECYKKHRSNTYNKDKIYNYNSIEANCAYCNKSCLISPFKIQQERLPFCDLVCYNSHQVDNFGEIENTKVKYNNSTRSETKPERMVREYLEENEVSFIQEYNIENTYYADFFFEDTMSIIEVMGDYWHANPLIYGDGGIPLNEMQRKKVKVDRRRKGHLKYLGYDVYYAWETDIKNNVDDCIGTIIQHIKNKQESSTTNTLNSLIIQG